ncbi:hypothetical protein Aab01nite_48190 [Paractinoplanes abujensis]|nr:hypothetical protein Aab01nite_48190 [Actinoplanes abujensis]
MRTCGLTRAKPKAPSSGISRVGTFGRAFAVQLTGALRRAGPDRTQRVLTSILDGLGSHATRHHPRPLLGPLRGCCWARSGTASRLLLGPLRARSAVAARLLRRPASFAALIVKFALVS